jgi:hypothetical protein
MALCGWICTAFLAAFIGSGCVTHGQVKSAYEREARMNVMRGRPALCTVGGEQKYVAEVGFWEMVLDNWPDYAKEGGVYVLAAAALYYYTESKDSGGGAPASGDTINNYYPAAETENGATE